MSRVISTQGQGKARNQHRRTIAEMLRLNGYSTGAGTFERYGAVNLTVSSGVGAFTVTGTSGTNSVNGAMVLWSMAVGSYQGSASEGSDSITFDAWMSPDKDFLGLVAEDTSATLFPEDYRFLIMNRN